MDEQPKIDNFISAVLLRYFRTGISASADARYIDFKRDRDLLRVHWSLSSEVKTLASYILQNRHETQSVLRYEVCTSDGPIRGRIDARATVIQRTVTGNNALAVTQEPVRSFATGPNQVLGWVLKQAWILLGRFLTQLPDDAAYRASVEASASLLSKVRKIGAIENILEESSSRVRPSAAALGQAAKSRVKIYRLAHAAYTTLLAMENGEFLATEKVLKETLLGPLEVWMRFELAVALGLAGALSEAISQPFKVNMIIGNRATPIIQVGPYDFYWQHRTEYYRPPVLDPSEIFENAVLSGWGIKPSTDRPDFVLVDRETNSVVSVIEAKYFSGSSENGWDRLRDATHQIVRYGRGYGDIPAISKLVQLSVVALATRPDDLPSNVAGQPFVASFSDLATGQCKSWAEAILQR